MQRSIQSHLAHDNMKADKDIRLCIGQTIAHLNTGTLAINHTGAPEMMLTMTGRAILYTHAAGVGHEAQWLASQVRHHLSE